MRSSSLAAEEMISLSNLLKPGHYITLKDRRLIDMAEAVRNEAPTAGDPSLAESALQSEWTKRLEQAEAQARQIVEQAKREAEQILKRAQDESVKMLADAKGEIEQWWEERRQEDQQHIEAAVAAARKQGYDEGWAEAEKNVLAEYESLLQEASAIVEKAHVDKERIIAEAEPFLLQLSIEIASKVIGKQLELSPQWIIEMIQNVLSRRKEQGLITLCVAPEHFAFVSEAREELMLVLDSQADLQIIPDKRVRDAGCIVRSSFGSIDARIDTQLAELKKALMEASAALAEERSADLRASG